MSVVLFYLFAALALVSAFIVVTTRNVVHSAFALMGALFCVSAFYVFLDAGFLAAIQLLVYVGGILVLVLFGVMMTSGSLVMKLRAPVGQLLPAGLVGLILLGLLIYASVAADPWKQILIAEDESGGLKAQIDAVAAAEEAYSGVQTQTIHPRLAFEFVESEGAERDVLPTRELSDLVERSLTRLKTERVYVVKSQPSPVNPRRHLVIAERRVASLLDEANSAEISQEQADLIAKDVAERTPEGFDKPTHRRPALLVITGLKGGAREELAERFGIEPVSDLKTSTGLGDAVMMGEFLLPFEVAGIILLVALIGAAVVSRKEIEA
ncbi:MAG: NADH-quinone oxidoreductase subunit J [Candidatus Poribacteria bacterium]|nr:NADH-quinone oxidoreductase subunit J [Candidatus Poribacteria bacterium]